MRKAFILAGAAASTAFLAFALGVAHAQGPAQPGAAEPQTLAPIPAGEAEVADDGACCESRGGCLFGHQCLYCKALGKWASYGAFNCSCRGSYKFPVPPQYTYHWPGMYSQQTMTEYASPYRFPQLKNPPVEAAEPEPSQDVGPPMRQTQRPIHQVSRLVPIAPATSPAEVRDETVSAKMKRHYGLD